MFACLDIVVSFIREGFYQQVSSEEKNHLHTNLLNWLCNKSSDFINNIPDYLKTKYAVLVALVIKVDYPQDWPDAFDVRIIRFLLIVVTNEHSFFFFFSFINVSQSSLLC